MQLVINLDENSSAASIAAKLRMQAGILEGMSAKEAASRKNTDSKKAAASDDADDEDEETEEDEDDAPKKKDAKKAKAKDDDDDETDADSDDSEDDADSDSDDETDEDAPPKKSAKAKKVTIAEVNDAAKAYAKENGVKATKAFLKKKFGSESISEIKAEKYPAIIKAMEV